MPRCRHCHHAVHTIDCQRDGCGCVRCEPVDEAAREARKRLWLVRAAFLTRNGWTRDVEVRVRAQTLTGAAMHGAREARRLALKPRARIQQARLTVVHC